MLAQIGSNTLGSLPLLAVNIDLESMLGALIYSLIGIVLFAVAFLVIVKVAPFSIRKEIEEDQNTSLGIIIGAVILGISMIISAAVQG
jgi:putative membrane protein